MANSDLATWYAVLYKDFGYESLDKYKKSKKFILGKVPAESALKNLVKENKKSAFLRIILPAKRCESFKDYIVILPQLIRDDFKNVSIIREIQNPILYNEEFYSVNEFIKISPRLESGNKPFCSYVLPLNLFMLPAKAFKELKEDYLTRIRRTLINKKTFEHRRGKIKNKAAKIKEFIISEFKKVGEPKPIPMDSILEALNGFMISEGLERDEYSESHIRKIIGSYLKKRHKK